MADEQQAQPASNSQAQNQPVNQLATNAGLTHSTHSTGSGQAGSGQASSPQAGVVPPVNPAQMAQSQQQVQQQASQPQQPLQQQQVPQQQAATRKNAAGVSGQAAMATVQRPVSPLPEQKAFDQEESLAIDMSFLEREVQKHPPARSVIKIVDSLIQQAFTSEASDIHLDPEEERLRVRFRVDGVLHNVFDFPKELHSEVITRIKVLSGLRTDEHQAAQDGRMRLSINEETFIDVRVSIAPTYYGENCVMRLLVNHASDFSLKKLGWSEHNLEKIERAMKKPYGLILATGPTGSGKTTTLYMILKELNKPSVSIITIEDPIEYSLTGVDQIQVNAKTGLTFANGLRSILRQDPNIVMIGEIRDGETASIAVNAAMTGHLVLSTLHTNDAPTTLPRLLDLGVEPFLIASTLNVAIGQRLVRMICSDCKVKRTLSEGEIVALRQSFSEKLIGDRRVFYKGEGCNRCGGSGYKSRIGIHEVLEVDEKIRDLIMKRANADEIRAAAVEGGMITMTEDGFEKAVQGITTLEEILRVFHE